LQCGCGRYEAPAGIVKILLFGQIQFLTHLGICACCLLCRRRIALRAKRAISGFSLAGDKHE
jgi:hypothetical protein